jgi:hypothetical protein
MLTKACFAEGARLLLSHCIRCTPTQRTQPSTQSACRHKAYFTVLHECTVVQARTFDSSCCGCAGVGNTTPGRTAGIPVANVLQCLWPAGHHSPYTEEKPLLNPTCTHLHPSRACLRLRCCRNYPSSLNGRSQPREAHTQAQHRGCTHSAHNPPQHGTARSMGPVRGGRCCCRTLRVRVARWRSRHPLPGVPLHRPLAVCCCCCARCRRCCPSMPAEVCIIERIEV